MKTDTMTLAEDLDVLAEEIQSIYGVVNAAILEASERLREMHRENNRLEALMEMRDNRIKSLHRALGDAIATYDPNRKETIVTAERQEAWINALNQ